MSSGGRKCPAGEVQVGERQQREHLRAILGEAAIAHLAIAELALHDTKHMLDFRAHLAEPAIAGTLAGRQPVVRAWPSPSPPRARPPLRPRASSRRWRSPCRHRPRCRHRGSNGPSPSHRARCRSSRPRCAQARCGHRRRCAPSCRSTIDCPSSRNASRGSRWPASFYFATTAVMSISSNIPSIANPLMTRNVFTGMGLPA